MGHHHPALDTWAAPTLSTMKENRQGWGFNPDQRETIRERARGLCELPAGCDRPNNNTVHHITGVYEARLDNKDKRAISDPSLNAVMLCDQDAAIHDEQEQFQIQCLLGEIAKI